MGWRWYRKGVALKFMMISDKPYFGLLFWGPYMRDPIILVPYEKGAFKGGARAM